MSAHILLVDDDRYLLDSLRRLLERNGYQVRTAGTAEDGWQNLQQSQPDLLVLDLGLPDVDGVSLCRRIRSRWTFPVLMLTARTDSMDKVVGLEVGADDYLTKPFDPHELVARVRAHLRRNQEYRGQEDASTKAIEFGMLRIDPETRIAAVGGQPLTLTAKEYELLVYMTKNADRALDREQMFSKVWGFDIEFSSNTLDVFVYRLRQKLTGAGMPNTIQTVRGYGYKFTLSP